MYHKRTGSSSSRRSFAPPPLARGRPVRAVCGLRGNLTFDICILQFDLRVLRALCSPWALWLAQCRLWQAAVWSGSDSVTGQCRGEGAVRTQVVGQHPARLGRRLNSQNRLTNRTRSTGRSRRRIHCDSHLKGHRANRRRGQPRGRHADRDPNDARNRDSSLRPGRTQNRSRSHGRNPAGYRHKYPPAHQRPNRHPNRPGNGSQGDSRSLVFGGFLVLRCSRYES